MKPNVMKPLSGEALFTGKKHSVVRDELKLVHGGLYAFMPFDKLDKHRNAVFKIGIAESFSKRLENYHTYFPRGVFMNAFLEQPPVPRITRANPKETKKKTHYQIIEKFILDYICTHGGKRVYSTTRVRNPDEHGSGATEWVYTNEDVVHEAFSAAKEQFGGRLELFLLEGDVDGKRVSINDTYKELKRQPNIFVGEIVYSI
jgi:hypothetical protein